MIFRISCLLLLMAWGCAAKAQTGRREAAAAVHAMFDAMRAGDSAALMRVLDPQAELCSAIERDGQTRWACGSVGAFARAVGTPHDEVWDERISRLRIRTDGPMASAWMDYEFYLGDRFSHRGVNSMTLFRSETGWKIMWISDTRR